MGSVVALATAARPCGGLRVRSAGTAGCRR